MIGAGASGLCAAYNLQRAGIPFHIVEKNATVGGTWWENRYPGAGVDTPNHLYSYSFASYDWTKYFVLRDELHDYLESVADQLDVRPSISFQTEVTSLAYDASDQRWTVNLRHADGTTSVERPNVVISGVENEVAFRLAEGHFVSHVEASGPSRARPIAVPNPEGGHRPPGGRGPPQ